MKPQNILLVLTLILASALLLTAAPVVFTDPVIIADDHDVITTGTLERAVSFGGVEQSVNGVTFISGETQAGKSSLAFENTIVEATDNLVVYLGLKETFAGESDPFTSLSEEYRSILSSGIYASKTSGSLTFTLEGLEKGKAYLIQFFLDDSRDFGGGHRSMIVASGDTESAPLVSNNTGRSGGVGQTVSATFTADSAEQVFTVKPINPDSDSAQLNAFQLRIVPTP